MKKNKKIIIAILLIILGAGLVVGGYILSKNNSNKAKPKEKEPKVEKADIEYSQKLSDLYNGVTNAGASYCGFYGLFTDKKMTVNDLSNEDIGKMIVYKLYSSSNKDSAHSWEGAVYSKEQIEETAKVLFGSDVKFVHGKIGECPSVDYDASKGQYVVSMNECDEVCDTYTTSSRIVQSKETLEGLLEFSVRVVFAKDKKYYSDYAKTKVITAKDGEYSNIDYEKGSLYKVVFKKENDKYVFSYVEPEK